MNDKSSLGTLNLRIESLEKALRLCEKEVVAYRSFFDEVKDISTQRKIEQLSGTIQKLAKIGVWEFDIDSRKYFATREAYRIMGMKPVSHGLEADNLLKKV